MFNIIRIDPNDFQMELKPTSRKLSYGLIQYSLRLGFGFLNLGIQIVIYKF